MCRRIVFTAVGCARARFIPTINAKTVSRRRTIPIDGHNPDDSSIRHKRPGATLLLLEISRKVNGLNTIERLILAPC